MELYREPITDAAPKGRRDAEKRAERAILDRVFGHDAVLAHHEDGSPYIVGRPDIFIAISHCSDECVMVVSDSPVGVDVETLRPQLARVAGKFLTEAESSRGPFDLMDLLKYWTAKEAAFKCYHDEENMEKQPVISEIEVSPDFKEAEIRGKIFEISITIDGDKATVTAVGKVYKTINFASLPNGEYGVLE